ncbi:hypothetical protein [Dyadobacter sp. 676]|uniref:Uncharacterized protein n=1 Tax=Dyadobacter sp. 676 TaxID=3088362 RepID=A0AAU8FVN0_9BACT
MHETYTIEDYTLRAYGEQYAGLLEALVNDRVTADEFAGVEYMNELFPH